jgi:hypothetical protein
MKAHILEFNFDRGWSVGGPVGGRENDGPKAGSRVVEFEGDVKGIDSSIIDPDNAATDFHIRTGIVEEKRLPDVEVLAHLKKAAMRIHDLSHGRFLKLAALLVFRQNEDARAQHNALAASPVLRALHTVSAPESTSHSLQD